MTPLSLPLSFALHHRRLLCWSGRASPWNSCTGCLGSPLCSPCALAFSARSLEFLCNHLVGEGWVKEKKISKVITASFTLATSIMLTGLSSHIWNGLHRYLCFWDTSMGSKCPTKATDSVASLAELSCKWEKQNFPLPYQRFTKLLQKILNGRGSSSLMLTHRFQILYNLKLSLLPSIIPAYTHTSKHCCTHVQNPGWSKWIVWFAIS